MVREELKELEAKMQHTIEAAKHEFAAVRTGRAHTGLVERLEVEAYGSKMPLNQLATISTPEPRMLVIQPWDRGVTKEIEKALLKSDLGLTPATDGNTIRIAFPPLTEERRRELVKVVKKEAEEKKVVIRNLRRDANERLKAAEKKGEVTEDEVRRGQEEIQKLTDKFIAEIEKLLAAKEREIMEV